MLAVLGELTSRALDILVSVALLLLLSPVLLMRGLLSRQQSGSVLVGRTCVGRF